MIVPYLFTFGKSSSATKSKPLNAILYRRPARGIVQMRQRIIAFFAFIALCSISSPSQSGELSGAWKIDTRGGPTPLCSLVQSGNNLNGSCVGPQASGTVTGTEFAGLVRWRWHWIAYGSNAAADFDFTGTLQPDNSITGMIERPDLGFSLRFTAKRHSLGNATVTDVNRAVADMNAARAQPPPPDGRSTLLGYSGPMNKPIMTAPVGPGYTPGYQPDSMPATAPKPGEYPPELEAQSRRIFYPEGGNWTDSIREPKRQQWMYNAQQQAIKNDIEMKKAGHDYSVEWRNR
jgi:hypothetical protein